ncbi:hypothetical protein [Nocardiopsis synnemataformans]|uniref:hypothetical protein n=1 Tax=Nocardiopsis synnemataformans TaxID=61305 RepID=UPI003EBB6FD0
MSTRPHDDLTGAPTQVQHMAALGHRRNITTTVTKDQGVYHVTISSTEHDRRIEVRLVRRGRRWVNDHVALYEGDTEVDLEGGIAGMLRALSQSGDLVGSPTANTRHQGTNPTLTTRSHTIIRV